MLTVKHNKITLNGNTPNCKTKNRRQKRDDNASRYKGGTNHFFHSIPLCDLRFLAEFGVHHSPFILEYGILFHIHGTVQKSGLVWTLTLNWPQSHSKDFKFCI